jgi:hypothetical protein
MRDVVSCLVRSAQTECALLLNLPAGLVPNDFLPNWLTTKKRPLRFVSGLGFEVKLFMPFDGGESTCHSPKCPIPKSDAYAAIHGQPRARDKTRGRQAKTCRNQIHVFRPAETVHRRTARNFLGCSGSPANTLSIGLNPARRDGVHTHAAR